MSEATLDIATPEQLAARLEQDIVRRGLSPDQRYLSTRQVGRTFGVSLSLAAQAMQLLADQEKLIRRDRSGTYVGSVGKFGARRTVKVVYVLMPDERANYSVVPLDSLISSLSHPTPDTHTPAEHYSVQIAFLPRTGDLQYVQQLLAPTKSDWELCGVVAISCSREVYRYLHKEGVPLVVLGSLDHDLQDLASIDTDHFESGRLLAQHLFDNGHERIAMLGISSGRPGDHDFLDGIVEAMTAEGKTPNSLIARLCPDNLDTLRAQAEATLSRPDRPTGVICRGERMLNLVLPIASQLGLRLPDDLEVVFETFSTAHVEHMPFTCVRTSEPFEMIAQRIGGMLRRMHAAKSRERTHVRIPVELRAANKPIHQ